MKQFILTFFNHLITVFLMGVGVYLISENADLGFSYMDSVLVSNGIMMCVYTIGFNKSMDKYIRK